MKWTTLTNKFTTKKTEKLILKITSVPKKRNGNGVNRAMDGRVIMLMGLPASGKSTVAKELFNILEKKKRSVF